MFELTGSYKYILPTMVAIMVSKWTSDALVKDSINDRMISQNGLPYLDHKRTYIPPLKVVDCMDVGEGLRIQRPYLVSELKRMCEVLRRGVLKDDGGFPVLDGEILVGYIGVTELEHCVGKSH